MQTIAYSLLDEGFVVFVSGKANIDDTEWQAYVRFVAELSHTARLDGRAFKVIVFAAEGAPNAKQRAAIADAQRDVTSRTATITASPIARYVLTAFGWLGFPIRGFSTADFDGAARYLKLTTAQRAAALAEAAVLARCVGASISTETAA